MRPPITPLLRLAILPLTLACGNGDGSALETARGEGLEVGFAIEPPYAFIDSDGTIAGHHPDLVRALGTDIGVQDIRWVPLEFDALIPALTAGRIDVIASGMFVRPDRARRVRFSAPTACVRPMLVSATPEETESDQDDGAVPYDGAPTPELVDPPFVDRPDHRDPSGRCADCRIAVIEGGVEQGVLRRAGYMVMAVPDLSTAAAAVRTGAADALAVSGPTGRAMVADDPLLTAKGGTLPPDLADRAAGCTALAFRPGDEDLAAAFDSALATLMASTERRHLAEFLGIQPDELP